ncbi:UDP-N-acetylglucosamine 1-carboxyvinyltransferase [Candidatus Endomicrobiellum trichonymphae]|uniref:UDP-N-acetylglucosamine 1-carboxyvinyltransferase n=1 Tax=Endomicrobium trichonymphae TaxID=1408204 RepID=A0A1E5IGJ1_ENDTX|nr:UDP-N-acetylglucosamine 1-carboxyvinyltransferase [Candidatus Endomicrobium trichonymphae]
MDKIVIRGGRKLKGEIVVSGSKNSALPILFATLLTNDPVTITNVPSLADIDTAVASLNFIGKKTVKKGNTVKAYSSYKYKHIAPYGLVRKMRASILIMGPLLARLKRAEVSLPGGCAIGARPVDIHLDAFKKLGAKISVEGGCVKTSAKNGLKGAAVSFRFPSVGATENILLAAVLAKGKTIITNAAREPEIEDLANVLNKMGAKVTGAGTKNIKIEGVDKLHGFTHEVIPDRIEAATYIIAAAITKGGVILKKVMPQHLKSVNDKLKESGLCIKETKDTISVKWVKNLKPQNVKTGAYPGFPTDVQAQWMALMCLLNGESRIEENVFENRFLHVAELQRFGADITISGKAVNIKGVKKFSGAPVMVSDLRAGAALVLAGLVAKGKTVISRIYHLNRGYDMLEKKLKKLGANIRKIHN